MLKFALKVRGFTLTEVMIGMMILTVAIVSATNLLMGLVNSNQNNLTTLQAYYLAQEGLEAVRNIRDTNWLLNREWLGRDSESQQLWGASFEIPGDVVTANDYAVNFEYSAFGINAGAAFRPWSIDSNSVAAIFRNVDGDNVYLGPNRGMNPIDTGFKRSILIKKYDCVDLEVDSPCEPQDQGKHVLVESKIMWNLGAKERELTLSAVLTDWKGGAL